MKFILFLLLLFPYAPLFCVHNFYVFNYISHGSLFKVASFVLCRYYYAVVECDSSATADYLYKTCDGVEFERTSNKLDLRFIPDSMEFKHQPRDIATEVINGFPLSSQGSLVFMAITG